MDGGGGTGLARFGLTRLRRARDDGLGPVIAADLSMAVGAGCLVGALNTLLPGVARKEGLDPVGLAALAASPFIANVLGALAGRLELHSPRHLSLIHAAGWVFLILVPVLPTAAWFPLVLACWLSFSFGMPIQLRLWGLLYPARSRGRLVAVVRTGRAMAAALVATAGGFLADRLGGAPIIGLAGLLGVLGTIPYSRVAVASLEGQQPEPDGQHRYTPREAIGALLAHPRIRLLALAQAVYGAGLIAATPLYPLILVDELRLTLGEIGMLGVVASFSTMATYVAWGALVDRRGAHPVLLWGALCGATVPLVYALAPSLPTLWIAALVSGVASAAMDSGITGALSESDVPVEERPRLMAAWNALTGMRGAVAPFVAGGLVQAGLLSPSTALLASAALAGAGFLLYVRIGKGTFGTKASVHPGRTGPAGGVPNGSP